ncbi:MAG: hypothetical protein KF688_06305 [Pirellulales bacterium]|nr:hypothetical protein [Pirellulales bacterium]
MESSPGLPVIAGSPLFAAGKLVQTPQIGPENGTLRQKRPVGYKEPIPACIVRCVFFSCVCNSDHVAAIASSVNLELRNLKYGAAHSGARGFAGPSPGVGIPDFWTSLSQFQPDRDRVGRNNSQYQTAI